LIFTLALVADTKGCRRACLKALYIDLLTTDLTEAIGAIVYTLERLLDVVKFIVQAITDSYISLT